MTYFRPEGLSSALVYFTSVFEMGTGGTTPVYSPPKSSITFWTITHCRNGKFALKISKTCIYRMLESKTINKENNPSTYSRKIPSKLKNNNDLLVLLGLMDYSTCT